MVLSVLRVLVAFGLACIAGALVKLGFATPYDVLTEDLDKLSWSLEQALLAATHSAVSRRMLPRKPLTPLPAPRDPRGAAAPPAA